MSRALTVLQVLPALNTGGVERSTLEIAAALVAAGHRSVVMSAGGTQVAELERGGSTHVQLDLGRKSPRTLLRVPALRRWLARERPDIVHVRSRLPAWMVHFALRRRQGRTPALVTTVHGLNSPGRYSAILARGDRVICVSETVRRYVLQHYPWVDPARLHVIPRGIDPDAFPFGYAPSDAWRDAFFAQYPALRGGPLLVLPGRGTRLKGHADAIRLLAALRERGIDAKLLLLGAREAGRDAYLQELGALAAALRIDDAVVATPPRADVRDVLAIADLVLQLSTKPEAFGRTVAEALSLGRPVLGLDHGGVGEILAQHFPAGRVPLGADDSAASGNGMSPPRADTTILAERAVALLASRPPSTPYAGPTLADMQRATLAVYADVLRERG